MFLKPFQQENKLWTRKPKQRANGWKEETTSVENSLWGCHYNLCNNIRMNCYVNMRISVIWTKIQTEWNHLALVQHCAEGICCCSFVSLLQEIENTSKQMNQHTEALAAGVKRSPLCNGSLNPNSTGFSTIFLKQTLNGNHLRADRFIASHPWAQRGLRKQSKQKVSRRSGMRH